MVIKEALIDLISSKLQEVGLRKTLYDGYNPDLNLVAQTIITRDAGQNVDPFEGREISEGIPEDALKRLLNVVGTPEKLADRMYIEFGNKYDDKTLQVRHFLDGISELQESNR